MMVDARITDIRYMAYMLATVCHETPRIKKYQKALHDKKGAPVIDAKTKQPVSKEVGLYTLFRPVEEGGKGKLTDKDIKPYFLSVKVAQVSNGAVITEQDGDTFSVQASGKFTSTKRNSKDKRAVGSNAFGKATDLYLKAEGVEHWYFGRGLVQLTWWNSYAESSVQIGRGLDLLFNPELLLDYDISYDVMTKGMLEGESFANGKSCAQYFSDTNTNYSGAREMVNGVDHAADIATLAAAFEETLLASKKTPL